LSNLHKIGKNRENY